MFVQLTRDNRKIISRFFVAGRRLVQSVAVWHTYLRRAYCSVGELLRNRKPCAYNQKVNKFPFRLSAQCLQLRCSPPPQYIFCLLCSNLLRPFESTITEYFFESNLQTQSSSRNSREIIERLSLVFLLREEDSNRAYWSKREMRVIFNKKARLCLA